MTGKIPPLTNGISPSPFRRVKARTAVVWAVLALGATVPARADQVLMRNGDRYHGQILSITTNSLVLQSEVLGTVKLPRGKVTAISFGSGVATNFSVPAPPATSTVSVPPAAQTNLSLDLSAVLRGLQTQTNLIQQVETQYLGAAGPEAKDKFNQLLNGLGSGQITLTNLCVEAKSAADQLRALKRELGQDAGSEVDAYLAILDNFLKETMPSGGTNTNQTGAVPTSKADPAPRQK
jgi:hypothetical protein